MIGLVSAMIARMTDHYFLCIDLDFALGTDVDGADAKQETIRSLGFAVAGLIALLTAVVGYKRVRAQEGIAAAQQRTADAQLETATAQQRTAAAQDAGNVQTIFNEAIINLGHSSPSVRLGGVYSLYELAGKEPELAKNIHEILCAHVRETTQDEAYRKKHAARSPSTEVQSLLNLLAKPKEGHPFGQHERYPIDLSRAYLAGANLFEAKLQGAVLVSAQLQGAMLWGARLLGARLFGAQLQGVSMLKAKLQGAVLIRTQLQGAQMQGVQLQGAMLWQARLQGANLSDARLQAADLSGAQLQRADLYRAQLQGAYATDQSGLHNIHSRIRARTGKKTELKTAVFAGSLTAEDMEAIATALEVAASFEDDAEIKADIEARNNNLIATLRHNHLDRPASYELPKRSGAIISTKTKPFTQVMADEIIAEYDKAMKPPASEPPTE